jgi:hypothetical protein
MGWSAPAMRGLTTRDANGNSIRTQAVLTIVPFWLLVSTVIVPR